MRVWPLLFVLARALLAGEEALPEAWRDGLQPGVNTGLAARVPNDAALKSDPNVFLVEDFESGKVAIPYKEGNKWTDLLKVADTGAFQGKFCGYKTWNQGEQGGACRFWLPKEAHQGPRPAYFLRAYRKFDKAWHPGDVKKAAGLKGMGLCCLKAKFDGRGGVEAGGVCDGTNWYTVEDQFVGWAGNGAAAQDGYYWFGHMYSYMPFPKEAVAQPGKIKVNDPPTTRFSCYADPYLYIQYEKWYCYELALYLNTPGQRDGEARYWIDGVLQARATQMCFRTVAEALPEVMCVSLYRTKTDFPQPMTLWMDNLVVARRYIGPASGGPPAPAGAKTPPAKK